MTVNLPPMPRAARSLPPTVADQHRSLPARDNDRANTVPEHERVLNRPSSRYEPLTSPVLESMVVSSSERALELGVNPAPMTPPRGLVPLSRSSPVTLHVAQDRNILRSTLEVSLRLSFDGRDVAHERTVQAELWAILATRDASTDLSKAERLRALADLVERVEGRVPLTGTTTQQQAAVAPSTAPHPLSSTTERRLDL